MGRVLSQVVKGEGGLEDSLDYCGEFLDYEAEEGELVYEEGDRGKRPLSLPGKDAIDDTQRMVVQVRAAGEGGGRKVEIVEDRGERRDRKRKVELPDEDRDRDRNEDSDSEKENEQK